MSTPPVLPPHDSPDAPRYSVELSTIDPICPNVCVRCLCKTIDRQRPMTFRRADKTVERVVAVQWPYCAQCYGVLKPLDKAQTFQSSTVFAQMALVAYGVGAAMDLYDFWFPSLLLFIPLIIFYGKAAKETKANWGLEWASVVDVYKDGLGSKFSFRNREYAERFTLANNATKSGVADSVSN